MNIREIARKLGGEGLLKKVDQERELQKKIGERLHALQTEIVARYEGDKEAEMLAIVALAEAFSSAYAVSACLVHHQQGGTADKLGELLSVAIRSLVKNIETVIETVDATESGVADKIIAAAKKHAKGE